MPDETKMIYADYNATTPIGPAASRAMEAALKQWGNPSSTHALGRQARALLDDARKHVADCCKVSSNEVVFTSGGSESNTMAVFGSFLLNPKSFRMITSSVEHSSLKGVSEMIEQLGGQVKYIGVLPDGSFNFEMFEREMASFKPNFVSVMASNNETGVIFPTAQIHDVCQKAGVPFHTDAVQTFGKLDPSLWNMADFISISSHKVFGPKGVGALIVKKNQTLKAIHPGGSQEIKRRGGTENMLGIVGFGAACTDLPTPDEVKHLESLRNEFEKMLTASTEGVSINGSQCARVPNTSNVRFQGISNELLMGVLDLDGICVSGGSACSSGATAPSHVLTEMGLTRDQAKESLRFSFCTKTQREDVVCIVSKITAHVQRIRERRSKSSAIVD